MTTEDKIPKITAGSVGAPPAWAVLQRRLIETMNDAAPLIVDKFTERGGAPYYADDLDDLYEIFFGWGLFYAIGGSERVLDMALDKWNAVTRWADSDIVSRKKHGMWNRGAHREPFRQQITKEYFNLALPHGAEWHHMGEANMTFYEMGLADPTISENFRRAQRFAGFLIGEDPDAPNYDPVHRIISLTHPQQCRAVSDGRCARGRLVASGRRDPARPQVRTASDPPSRNRRPGVGLVR